MPWFITAVESTSSNTHRSRTFGFYNEYNQAYEAIIQNFGNMQECIYDYLVLEYIEPGIHPVVHTSSWFLFEDSHWCPIHDIDIPDRFSHITNWALG